jgi:hypothetical protein
MSPASLSQRVMRPLLPLAAPLLVAAGLGAILGGWACARREPPRHVWVERVTAVPRDVAFYPHVLYGGDDVYLVDGRWYRPGAEGWVVFTREPVELEMVRRAAEPPRARAFLGM